MWLHELEQHERKIASQNGEDGVLLALFDRLGTTDRFFVEVGDDAEDDYNGAFLAECGWRGLRLGRSGVSKNPRVAAHQERVTAENVNELLRRHGVPAEFDLLSIDLDGNDYWVWKALDGYRPRVVVVEYNASVPPDQRRAIPYQPDFVWDGSDHYGASLLALRELGRRKGYELVHCEGAGVNAFFVARHLLPAGFAARPVERVYRAPNYYYQGKAHPPDPTRRMIDPDAAADRPARGVRRRARS
jgi:hypothetical protein